MSIETQEGELPIHTAARHGLSPNFIKILVNTYPESVRIPHDGRKLPIHWACESDNCSVDTVKYLIDIYPESINIVDIGGWLPIHYASLRGSSSQTADVIEQLLLKDPTCASKSKDDGQYPLHVACRGANLASIQLLFDSYPWAFVKRDNEGRTPLQFARRQHTRIQANEEGEYMANNSQKAQVVNFLQAQQFYVNGSPESLAVQDENGLTPLHHALKNNAPLGSIKLLVKKSTSITQIADRNNAFPLHIACEFSSVKVVRYLMEMHDEHTRNRLDVNKDSILHYACRGGNCEVVKYLLDEQSQHVIERNVDGKLPIHLMCEFGSSTTDTGEGDRQADTEERDDRPRVALESFGKICKYQTLFHFILFNSYHIYSHSCLCLSTKLGYVIYVKWLDSGPLMRRKPMKRCAQVLCLTQLEHLMTWIRLILFIDSFSPFLGL